MPYVKPSANKKSQIWTTDGGDLSSLTMCRLNLNFKIVGELLVCHMGGQSSLTMCRLNLNIKNVGEILVWSVILGRAIIFHHVQAESYL